MSIYFLSDLHLCEERPDITAEFISTLQTLEKLKPDAIFILGDLFNFWIGDKLVDEFSAKIAEQIKQISKIIPVFFLRGNRDFLIDQKFCQLSGMILLPDIFIFEYADCRILLEHGDLLCTNDINYQKLRRILRSKLIYHAAKIMPSFINKKLAKFLRAKSHKSTKHKTKNILNTNLNAIKDRFVLTKADIIVHGHTHCPGVQSLHKKNIVVLGDWNPMGKTFLFSSKDNFELILSGDLATKIASYF